MIRGAVAFHGLRIEWSGEAASDPVRRLFAAYELDSPTGNAAITFHVGAGAAVETHGFEPIFERDGFSSFERAGELLLRDGEAWVRVSADGRRVEVANPDGARDEHGFVESTLLIALALALGRHGLYYLHAGAIVLGDGRRVLVAGDSGAGKSTVTLALLEPGGRVLGDDTVFFAERDGRPRVLAFWRPFHVGTATHAAHPSLLAGPIGRRGKRAVPLAALPVPLAREMDAPDLILFPEIAGEATTEAVPMSQADAFGAAMQSSAALADAHAADQLSAQLDLLRRLLEKARPWRLRLGADCLADRARIAAAVRALP
jgi:hypothetical protein